MNENEINDIVSTIKSETERVVKPIYERVIDVLSSNVTDSKLPPADKDKTKATGKEVDAIMERIYPAWSASDIEHDGKDSDKGIDAIMDQIMP